MTKSNHGLRASIQKGSLSLGHHTRVSSSWAHILMASVLCWSSCHVVLLKVSAWPFRHDTDTSPLREEKKETV
ncbi:hypothetical protein EYF80_026740 [Liparis tanakae]|uniref:Uncharacterized protein n=1 Tax=Liparis tanakae TaxID=230148 RepID=A0A4Z2HDZ8_9TELE|nr:hypothetical protein EYF80_026740 [Liparis tanakae]